MTVGSVIVSYRTPHLTRQAAASALDAGMDEVTVLDNASGDDTVTILRAMDDKRLLVIQSETNAGFGTAANRGFATIRSDSVVFLNSDAQLSTTAKNRMLAELYRSGGGAIIGPRLVSPGGSIQPSAGLLPRPYDLALRAVGLHTVGRWMAEVPVLGRHVRRMRLVREYGSAPSANATIQTDMVSGACFAIGREAFEALGGFDERFFMYFEDADLCRRAAAAGLPIRYVPDAVVTHIGGASSSDDYHFGPFHARAMRQYLGKWYGPTGSSLAMLLLWLRAVAFTIALRPGMRRAWRAWWAALRDTDPRR